ncbi:Major facilitator superfamily like protein [Aduncisulcus paluster]|uniref:Major facilitator superfamily like protein n=1 Tax=Aduncisulcus paluster TaxID=2918883 RepID=A0ABQ5KV38_9EUKA|nr:Major facilitator superfamily like protein [Aduncisulcus paluster]|eukprot:gnl/Carplike_NY0171/601_a823_2222.p1 GENE.gnl/Carplike_NY0171/601_a823_2222~~gnl/Carplike_NY0171/601_a823_2222.p1  ORF type:complete len:775 (+),score=285.18 gnl/Carplike_NY0171/601_a823_2222:32-2356(+)
MGFAEFKKKFQFKKTSNLELHPDAQSFLRGRRLIFVAMKSYSQAKGYTNYFTENSGDDVNYDPIPGIIDGHLLSLFVSEADPRFRTLSTQDTSASTLTRSSTKFFKAMLKWAKDEGFSFDHPLGSTLQVSDVNPTDTESHALMVIQLADIIQWSFVEFERSLPISEVDESEVDSAFLSEEVAVATGIYGDETVALHDVSKDLRTEPNIFNTGVFGYCIAAAVCAFGLGLINIAQVTHLKNHMKFMGLAIENWQYTLFVSVFNIVQFFASVILQGPVSERIGRKWTFIFVAIWYALTDMCFIWINGRDGGYWAIVAVRAASGIAALIAPLGYLCVSDLSPPKSRTLSLCLYTAAIYFGIAFSPLVNRALVNHFIPDSPTDDDYINVLKWAGIYAMCARVVSALIAIFFTKESSPIILANRELKAQAKKDKASGVVKSPKEGVEMTEAKEEATEESTEKDHFKHSKFWGVFKMLFTNKDFILLFISYTMCVGAYSVVRDLNLAWMMDMPIDDLWINFTDATQPIDASSWPYSYLLSFKSEYPKWLSNYQFVSSLWIYGFMVFFSIFVGPWFTRRAGEMNLTFIGHAMNLIGMVLQGITPPLVDNVWASAVFSVIGAFSEACAHPAFLYMLSLFSLPSNRGSVTGISQIGNSIGRAIPTLLIGFTFDALETVGPVTVNVTGFGDVVIGEFALDGSKGYTTYLTAIPMVVLGVICQMFAKVPILRHELDFRQSFIEEVKKHTRHSSVMDLDKFTRIRNFSIAESTLHKTSDSGSVSKL